MTLSSTPKLLPDAAPALPHPALGSMTLDQFAAKVRGDSLLPWQPELEFLRDAFLSAGCRLVPAAADGESPTEGSQPINHVSSLLRTGDSSIDHEVGVILMCLKRAIAPSRVVNKACRAQSAGGNRPAASLPPERYGKIYDEVGVELEVNIVLKALARMIGIVRELVVLKNTFHEKETSLEVQLQNMAEEVSTLKAQLDQCRIELDAASNPANMRKKLAALREEEQDEYQSRLQQQYILIRSCEQEMNVRTKKKNLLLAKHDRRFTRYVGLVRDMAEKFADLDSPSPTAPPALRSTRALSGFEEMMKTVASRSAVLGAMCVAVAPLGALVGGYQDAIAKSHLPTVIQAPEGVMLTGAIFWPSSDGLLVSSLHNEEIDIPLIRSTSPKLTTAALLHADLSLPHDHPFHPSPNWATFGEKELGSPLSVTSSRSHLLSRDNLSISSMSKHGSIRKGGRPQSPGPQSPLLALSKCNSSLTRAELKLSTEQQHLDTFLSTSEAFHGVRNALPDKGLSEKGGTTSPIQVPQHPKKLSLLSALKRKRKDDMQDTSSACQGWYQGSSVFDGDETESSSSSSEEEKATTVLIARDGTRVVARVDELQTFWGRIAHLLQYGVGRTYHLRIVMESVLYRPNNLQKQSESFGFEELQASIFTIHNPVITILEILHDDDVKRQMDRRHQQQEESMNHALEQSGRLVGSVPYKVVDAEAAKRTQRIRYNAANPRVRLKIPQRYRQNGIVNFIGTRYGQAPWSNPMAQRLVLCQVSSEGPPPSNKMAILAQHREQPEAPIPYFVTQNKPNQWVMIDMGTVLVIPQYYSFASTQPIMAGLYPRYWRIEGSLNNKQWTVLRRHVYDETITKDTPYGVWSLPCLQEACDKPRGAYYRYFRIVMDGPNSMETHELQISCFEIYGRVICVQSYRPWQTTVTPQPLKRPLVNLAPGPLPDDQKVKIPSDKSGKGAKRKK